MTHTYSIRDLERETSTGLVTKVYWTLTTTDESITKKFNDEFTLSGSPSDEGFINWDSLTEEDVIVWVNQNVDNLSSLESALEEAINQTPIPEISKGLAW